MIAKFPPPSISRQGAMNQPQMLNWLQRSISDTGHEARLFSRQLSFPAGFWITYIELSPSESLAFRADPALMALVIDEGGTP